MGPLEVCRKRPPKQKIRQIDAALLGQSVLGFLTLRQECSFFVLMSDAEQDGVLHTLGLPERLRDDLRDCGAAREALYWRVDGLLGRPARTVPG